MLTLIWLGIVAIAILALVIVIRHQQQNSVQAPAPPPAEVPLQRSLFTLQLGDIVQYDGIDWVVEGRLTYEQDGDMWLDYMVQDHDTIRWLSVEEGDRVEVCWLETITDLEVSQTPPAQLNYQGETYHRRESGVAAMSHLGTILNHAAETCRYTDYTGPDQRVLSVENWDGDVEITIGKRIRPSALTLLPGDGQRVYDD